jgi:hypothetical protein
MILSPAQPNQFPRTFAGGVPGSITEYVGLESYTHSDADPYPMPQAFKVEKLGTSVSLPHFHVQNQYQVFVSGRGTFGPHAVQPFSVHYASRYTGYGPIKSGREGIAWLTLRQAPDQGALYLPQDREKQNRTAPQRQFMKDAAASSAGSLRSRREMQIDALIEPQTDCVAAWTIRVPPRATVKAPDVPGGGRFYVVIAGAMILADQQVPPIAPFFVHDSERVFDITAGDEGLEVLALQFPND